MTIDAFSELMQLVRCELARKDTEYSTAQYRNPAVMDRHARFLHALGYRVSLTFSPTGLHTMRVWPPGKESGGLPQRYVYEEKFTRAVDTEATFT